MKDFIVQNSTQIILMIASLILGGAVSWFLCHKYANIKRLTICINHSEILRIKKGSPDDLSILYKGKAVQHLSKTVYYIWNSGQATIKGSDISQRDKLRIESDGTVFILNSFNLGKMSNGVSINAENKTYSVSFDYLDKNDGCAISIIHNSDNIPKVSGTLMGAKIVIDKDGPKLSTLKKSSKAFLIVMLPFNILVSISAAAALIYLFIQRSYIVGSILILFFIPFFISMWKGFLKSNFINIPPTKICVMDSQKNSSQEKGD